MSLAKPVRSLVSRAVARGAVYEDGVLKKPDGTIIVGVPQDMPRPDKLRKFQLAVTSSGILDGPIVNGHAVSPEAELDQLPPGPLEEREPAGDPPDLTVVGGTESVVELTIREAAERAGMTEGAVGQAVHVGSIPSRLGPPRPGQKGGKGGVVRYVLSSDIDAYAATRAQRHRAQREPREPRAQPDAAALVASVRPVSSGARTRYDMGSPSGRLSAGVAQVKAARAKLDPILADLNAGLDAIEAESTGMLHELADSRAKLRKVEQLIGRAVDAL